MKTYAPHPAIALRDNLSARGVTTSAGNNALKIYPRTGIAPEDQPVIRRWARVLAALAQNQNVWLVWDSVGGADAVIPLAADDAGWHDMQRRWLHDDGRFTERAGWIRMQWWRGTTLLRDAYVPTVSSEK